MGALDGFYSTWNKARETFGQGVPTDGSQFDHSSELLNMKASVEAAEVKNAANVVSTGRTNLDTTKGWVESMVSSLPATSEQDRERKLIPIAREGINKVNNIVNSATDEMRTIQGRVTGYKGEYEQLTNQKFAPGGDKDGEKDEEQRSGLMGEEGTAEDSGRAEEDVRDTIEGDPQAADRVAEVINSLTDDQLNRGGTPERYTEAGPGPDSSTDERYVDTGPLRGRQETRREQGPAYQRVPSPERPRCEDTSGKECSRPLRRPRSGRRTRREMGTPR
ncbi:hypothetical protein NLB33_34350 [Mycolicibacterium smegmatis]|nr:hypothetical protein [Mycolicibacterium smegmatis]MCP2627934.1 hypothetical protein [Mycolicibacterium smegmatis]